MTPSWKRFWRPFVIPLILLLALGVTWYYLSLLRELRPTPEMRARLEAICKKANVPYPIPSARIVAHKSAHTLELYSGDTLVKTYRITSGRVPGGAKAKADDGKTPEGQYWICEKIPRAKYHRYLGLNYPNAADASRGFNAGTITLRDREEIFQANRAKRWSQPHTPLGSAIGIHGGSNKTDWTEGSIAMDDRDVEEIFYAVRLKDPVQINP